MAVASVAKADAAEVDEGVPRESKSAGVGEPATSVLESYPHWKRLPRVTMATANAVLDTSLCSQEVQSAGKARNLLTQALPAVTTSTWQPSDAHEIALLSVVGHFSTAARLR